MKNLLKGVLALSLFVLGTTAQAQNGYSDTLTVFNPDGTVFASVSAKEEEEQNDPKMIAFINIPGLADPNQPNATTLVEPDGSYSDIFGVYSPNGTDVYLAFNSDTEDIQAPFGDQGSIFLHEGNGVHDATMYLSPGYRGEGFTATFVSDVENVPELDASALMGIGMAGLAGMSLRHRRRARKA